MLLQLPTVDECRHQPFHHFCLFWAQLVRMLLVKRRETGILQWVRLPLYFHRTLLQIHLVQQQAVFHLKFWPPVDELPLQLKLDHGNRLMHLLIQSRILDVILFLPVVQMEYLARILPIGRQGKLCKWD